MTGLPPRSTTSWLTGVAGLIAMAVLLVSCQGTSSVGDNNAGDDFWESARITADQAEYYSTIAEMASAADAVVVGRLSGRLDDRQVQGDVPEDVVTYLIAQFDVSRVLAGELSGTSIPLEFLIVAAPATEVEQLELPTGDMVVFLREKRGRGEEGRFRAVNSRGLWASSRRAELDTPLAEEPPQASVFADEVASVGSVADWANYVEDQAGK